MRFSPSALVAPLCIAGLSCVLLSAPALRADGPIRALGGSAPKPVAAALNGAKKLELVSKSLKDVGAAPIASVPPAQMKVTPIAPVHEGGAKIAYATPLAFHGPQPSFPEGAFVLDYGPNAKNEMRLDLTTENGKLYLLDCKLSQFWGTSPLVVHFKRNGAAQALNAEDGHYLYTFKSDKPAQSVQLWTEHSAGFYGCELTKLN